MADAHGTDRNIDKILRWREGELWGLFRFLVAAIELPKVANDRFALSQRHVAYYHNAGAVSSQEISYRTGAGPLSADSDVSFRD